MAEVVGRADRPKKSRHPSPARKQTSTEDQSLHAGAKVAAFSGISSCGPGTAAEIMSNNLR
jgi:hypothetical protein